MGLELVVAGLLFPPLVVGGGELVGGGVVGVGDAGQQHDELAGSVAGPVGHVVLDDTDQPGPWAAVLVEGGVDVGEIVAGSGCGHDRFAAGAADLGVHHDAEVGAVGQDPDDGQGELGRRPPQQARAGRGGGVPRRPGVEATVGGEELVCAQPRIEPLRADELLTADRGFYSWAAWDTAAATGAGLLWRAPTQLTLPVVRVLPDGTYLSVVMDSKVRGTRRETIVAAARAGHDFADVDAALDEHGRPRARLVRVIEYDVPDRAGNGTGELIVLLTSITDPDHARADELAAAYHQRWEEETSNDQLKTHLRGPGKVLRSRLPDLAYQEIWAYLIVHHAISALIAWWTMR